MVMPFGIAWTCDLDSLSAPSRALDLAQGLVHMGVAAQVALPSHVALWDAGAGEFLRQLRPQGFLPSARKGVLESKRNTQHTGTFSESKRNTQHTGTFSA